MKKLLVSLATAFVLVFSFVLGSGYASAHAIVPTRPDIPNQDCANGCVSIDDFTGSQHGLQSLITVSNPALNSASAWWDRSIEVDNNGTEAVTGGVVKKGAFTLNFCSVSAAGLYYFAEYTNSSGVHSNVCVAVPSGDIGFQATVELSRFVSGTGGMFITICGLVVQSLCPGSSPYYINGASQTWANGVYAEFTNNFWFPPGSSKNVWLSKWANNQYSNVNTGVWTYFPNGANGSILARNPPQMYWFIFPDGSNNNGGQLATCDYDSTLGDLCS